MVTKIETVLNEKGEPVIDPSGKPVINFGVQGISVLLTEKEYEIERKMDEQI